MVDLSVGSLYRTPTVLGLNPNFAPSPEKNTPAPRKECKAGVKNSYVLLNLTDSGAAGASQ